MARYGRQARSETIGNHCASRCHIPLADGVPPYTSAGAVLLILHTAIQVFEDFTYHRELVSADGLNTVLEFSARIGDKHLKGIDFIRYDEQGLIVEFEVMVRPFSGLQALAAAMAVGLGDKLGSLKG